MPALSSPVAPLSLLQKLKSPGPSTSGTTSTQGKTTDVYSTFIHFICELLLLLLYVFGCCFVVVFMLLFLDYLWFRSEVNW